MTLAVGVVYTARALYREARLSRLKTDFVSLVSHELRTPLTSIRMFIETLALGRVKDPAQTQEVLELLAKETERLSDDDRAGARLGAHRERPQARTSGSASPVTQLVDASLDAFRAQRLDSERASSPCEVPEDAARRWTSIATRWPARCSTSLQNAYKYTGAREAHRARAPTRDGRRRGHRRGGQRRGHRRARPQAHLRPLLPGGQPAHPQDRGHRAWGWPSPSASWRRTAARITVQSELGKGSTLHHPPAGGAGGASVSEQAATHPGGGGRPVHPHRRCR